MKIEKLTENKIRVIINLDDLKKNNLDFHTIMQKPIESQKLFLEMLLKAEKELGFYTEGCKLLVEAFSSSEDVFIFTITKYIEKSINSSNKPQVKVKKKTIPPHLDKTTSIYKLSSFDEFCNFCICIKNKDFNLKQLSKNTSLCLYKNTYYLIFSNINTQYKYLNSFYSTISEFATLVSHSEELKVKLFEHGKIIMKKNALAIGFEYFSN